MKKESNKWVFIWNRHARTQHGVRSTLRKLPFGSDVELQPHEELWVATASEMEEEISNRPVDGQDFVVGIF